jgi:hypothetical protein
MSKQAVFCIVAYITRANHIVDRLKFANFPDGEISVLFPTSAVPSTQISGALGWLASISNPLSEIGPFIATGPVMTALADIEAGAEADGIFGGLLGVGLTGPEARWYEEKVREGNILLSVHTEKRRGLLLAKKIFEQSGAQDVCFVGDASSLDNLAGRGSHRLEIASPAFS